MNWIDNVLPDANGLYLCWIGIHEILEFRDGKWYDYDEEFGEFEVEHVKAWMPLPANYE